MGEIEFFRANNNRKYFFYNINELDTQAAVALIVERGSFYEEKNEKGYCHFLEHILISFDKYMPDANIKCEGYTDFFYTYYIFMTTTKFVDKCLELIEGIIHGSYITKEIVEDIRGDIIAEYHHIKQDRNKKEYTKLLDGTAYADHLAIGELTVINSCNPIQLKEFHGRMYHNEFCNVIILGNFNLIGKTKLENLVQEKSFFGAPILTKTLISRTEVKWRQVEGERHCSIFFYRKRKRLSESELVKESLYDDIVFLMIEEAILSIYGETVNLTKYSLSDTEEFIGLCLKANFVRNNEKLREFMLNIKKFITKSHVCEFLKEYIEEYEKIIKNGFGINLEKELHRCIKSMIYERKICGCKDFHNMVKHEIYQIKVQDIYMRMSLLLNENKSVYMVIEGKNSIIH